MTSFTYLYSFITMPKVHGYLAPEPIMVYCVFLCRIHALIKSLCSHLIMTCPLRKSVRIRSYSVPYFHAFGLNMER